MQTYQVRAENREGKDHLIVCVAKIGKHKMTVNELAIEVRAGFKGINDRIDDIVNKNNLVE